MRTFKVPFTVSLMGVAEVEAETYEDAVELFEYMAVREGFDSFVTAMNVETADEEPKSEDDDA